jgi:hypothetical protein
MAQRDDELARADTAGKRASRSAAGAPLARVGLVGHAQVGAQHVDAGLPVRPPVIGPP